MSLSPAPSAVPAVGAPSAMSLAALSSGSGVGSGSTNAPIASHSDSTLRLRLMTTVHTWCIDPFSLLSLFPKGMCERSDEFEAGGHMFYAEFYPSGFPSDPDDVCSAVLCSALRSALLLLQWLVAKPLDDFVLLCCLCLQLWVTVAVRLKALAPGTSRALATYTVTLSNHINDNSFSAKRYRMAIVWCVLWCGVGYKSLMM